jgi:hypothetical protein
MSKLAKDAAGNLYPDIVGKFGTSQTITATGTSLQSTAFGQETTLVRVATTNLTGAGAHITLAIGANPTATANDPMIPCGLITYVAVSPGDKIAVLRGASTNIDVSLTEITNY